MRATPCGAHRGQRGQGLRLGRRGHVELFVVAGDVAVTTGKGRRSRLVQGGMSISSWRPSTSVRCGAHRGQRGQGGGLGRPGRADCFAMAGDVGGHRGQRGQRSAWDEAAAPIASRWPAKSGARTTKGQMSRLGRGGCADCFAMASDIGGTKDKGARGSAWDETVVSITVACDVGGTKDKGARGSAWDEAAAPIASRGPRASAQRQAHEGQRGQRYGLGQDDRVEHCRRLRVPTVAASSRTTPTTRASAPRRTIDIEARPYALPAPFVLRGPGAGGAASWRHEASTSRACPNAPPATLCPP
jgi:hypothetical protein